MRVCWSLLTGLLVLALTGCGKAEKKEALFTCKKCHSVCQTGGSEPGWKNWMTRKYVYRSKEFSDCEHEWLSGVAKACPGPLADGTIVLVKQGNGYGAFKLYNQQAKPDAALFKWWWRNDGKGTFSAKDVRHGDGVAEQKEEKGSFYIKFGRVRIEWSCAENGKGYIYYQYYPWEKIPADGLKICIIKATGIDQIDAASPKWQYRTTTEF